MSNILIQRFYNLSLRTHLLLMALLLALPAIVLIIHSGLDERRNALREGIDDGRRLVYSIAAEQYNLTGNAEQLITVLAQLPDIRGHKVAAANAILADTLKIRPEYGNIIIADRNGDVWASALPMTTAFSIKDKRSFRNALTTKQFSSGEYIIGRISTVHTIGFGYPVINARGEVESVIAVNFNFDKFNQLLQKAGLPDGSSFTVVDHNGVIIDRSLDKNRFVGRQDRADLFQRMKDGPDEDTFIDSGLDAGKQIISYRKLYLHGEQSPYLYIRASIPLQKSLAVARRNQLRDMVLLSPFLLVSLVLVLVIAKACFVNRIDKLQEASQRLARGDHQVKVSEYVTGGELGRLGHSFDEMARQLADREQALRASEAEFRFLAENSADIIWRIGADRRIEYISPADECLRGYRKDEVIGHYIEEMVSPDDAALLLEMQAKRLDQEQQGIRTGALRFEISLLRKDGGTIWAEVISSPIRDEDEQIIGYHGVARDIGARKRAEEEREALIAELQDALGEIKTLSGMLPICASCKKIRDDSGYWNQLEIYISKHSDVMFSHGLCPDCLKVAYEELEEFARAKTDC